MLHNAGIEHFRAQATIEAAGADDDAPMTIGDVAQQFGTTARALRFYEAKRLIAPQRNGRLRLYTREQRDRLALILTGKRLGFTLVEVGELLGKSGDDGLRLTREQCVAQISHLEQQKRSLEIALAELRKIHTSFYRRLVDGTNGSAR
jgi:DNA-binding transcriptional MerR regulator